MEGGRDGKLEERQVGSECRRGERREGERRWMDGGMGRGGREGGREGGKEGWMGVGSEFMSE